MVLGIQINVNEDIIKILQLNFEYGIHDLNVKDVQEH